MEVSYLRDSQVQTCPAACSEGMLVHHCIPKGHPMIYVLRDGRTPSGQVSCNDVPGTAEGCIDKERK